MLIELSYPIHQEMPSWPNNPKEQFVPELTHLANGCQASSWFHHLHNGTHVDAPRHFDPAGPTIDQLPAEDFYYKAPLMLHLPKERSQRITRADLEAYHDQIAQCDILLLYTGFSKCRVDAQAYADDFPSVHPDACHYLRKEFPKLKALAIDTIGYESVVTGPSEGSPSHHACLERNEAQPQRTLLLYEDVNLAPLVGAPAPTAICAFPLRLEGMEASPVAMVAFC